MSIDHLPQKIDGKTVYTGLQVAPTLGSAFQEFPAGDICELKTIHTILANKRRKPNWQKYKRRRQQGRRSSCLGYASTTGMEVKRRLLNLEERKLSGEDMYRQINGGRDGGAILEQAMKASVKSGVATEDLVPYESYRWKGSMEEERFIRQTREDNQVLDVYAHPSRDVDEMWKRLICAIVSDDPAVMAVHCGRNFFRADGQGNCSVDRGPGNHAVCGIDVVRYGSGWKDLKIFTVNSHGKRFGANGCYLTTFDHIVGPSKYHVFYSYRSLRRTEADRVTTLLD